MASKFDSYQKAKAELSSTKEWLGMIGAEQPRTTAKAKGFISSRPWRWCCTLPPRWPNG